MIEPPEVFVFGPYMMNIDGKPGTAIPRCACAPPAHAWRRSRPSAPVISIGNMNSVANEFDQKEVRGIIQTLLSPSRRDLCFTGSYYRAVGNIESTLSLKSLRAFQAIAMMARSLFELDVDIKLTAQTPDSETRIIAFVDVEKLRSARKIVEFKAANPNANVHPSTYQEFITNKDR